MRKFWGIVLGAILACSAFACGGGGGNVMHTATVDDMNGRLGKNAADLVVTFENSGFGAQWIVDLKNKFQTATGKTVYLEGEKGISGFAPTRWETGNDCSDVFFIDNGHSCIQQIAQGWVEDISDVLETEVENGKTVEDLLYTSFKDYGRVTTATYDGYYYLPWTAGVGSFFYNAEILETAGWSDPPETYAELLELVADINNLAVNKDGDTSNDIQPFVWSTKSASYWQFIVETWFVQLVGKENYAEYEKMENLDFFDPEKTWTNPETGEQVNFAAKKREALTLLEGLIVDPATKDIINTSKTDSSKDYVFVQSAFAEGKAAMIPNGAWLERELANGGIPEEQLEHMRVMSVPFAPNAKKDGAGEYIKVNNTLAYNYCMIPEKAAHKELAKEFIVFSLTQDNLKSFTYESYGFRPYEYEINKASLSFCAQDIRTILTEAEASGGNFTFNPKSELAFTGVASMWYYNPFSNMLTGSRDSRKSAAECISLEKDSATSIWQYYLS